MRTSNLGTDADLQGNLPLSFDSDWNTRVDTAPLMPGSAQIISEISPTVGIHPDFGSGLYGGIPIGIPYVVVPADQDMVAFIDNIFASESDPGPFPIPTDPTVQGTGATAYNDHHLIVVQLDPTSPTGFGKDYEFFQASQNADGTWQGFASEFDLNGGDLQRPLGWTSASGSGMPIFPGLLKYDEVQQAIADGGVDGYVHHALAFTLSSWFIGQTLFGAAEHTTDGTGVTGFGEHFRLSADYVVDPSLPIECKIILNTLKIYGMILTDNGGNFFLSGAPDERWNNQNLALLQQSVHGSDFQVVDTSTLHIPKPITIGSGSDALVLTVYEDDYQGNASFTVSIDGNPIVGTQTTTATTASGNTQAFTFLGNWGPGQHNVTVTYANPLTDAGGARNLYLKSMTFDGSTPTQAITAPILLTTTTPAAFSIGQVTTVGTGADKLTLAICEDNYKADAQFTVSVDGIQVGGTQTATATRAMGHSQNFVFQGDWGTQQHTVTVNFLNGVSDPSGNARNLFVWGTNYDGKDNTTDVANLYGGGATTFQIGDPVVVGTGSDSVALHLCEDAYQGINVQYTLSVDGVQVGGVQTDTQYRSSGKTQDVTFNGNWGAGAHTVTVNVLNGENVRSLFVWGMNYNGEENWSNVSNLYGGGAVSFQVGHALAAGTGPDSVALHLCEDTYQGINVKFTLSVDGVQVGGTQTATQDRSSGKTQDMTFNGNWGPGVHTVTVNVLNGENVRSLFVWGMNYNGGENWSNVSNLYGGGSASFKIGTPVPSAAAAPAPSAGATVSSAAPLPPVEVATASSSVAPITPQTVQPVAPVMTIVVPAPVAVVSDATATTAVLPTASLSSLSTVVSTSFASLLVPAAIVVPSMVVTTTPVASSVALVLTPSAANSSLVLALAS